MYQSLYFSRTRVCTLVCTSVRTLVCTFCVPVACLLVSFWSVFEQCYGLHFVYTIVYTFVCTVSVLLHSVALSFYELISFPWFTRQCKPHHEFFTQSAAFSTG